jgi:hypothetical protein
MGTHPLTILSINLERHLKFEQRGEQEKMQDVFGHFGNNHWLSTISEPRQIKTFSRVSLL